jgi:hypothetical protein
VGLVVLVGLPILAHWARRAEKAGCALDGTRVDPVYRVVIVDGRGRSQEFCCLRCAELWLGRQPVAPRTITVTDETTGEEIAADAAFYVRSSVVTTPATRNRIHVFRRQADAARHAEAFSGTVLSGAEQPFR